MTKGIVVIATLFLLMATFKNLKASDDSLALDVGENGYFSITYHGKPLLINGQPAADSNGFPCPTLISRSPSWHSVHKFNDTGVAKLIKTAEGAKTIASFSETLAGISKTDVKITIDGLKATIEYHMVVQPANSLGASLINFTFKLPADSYWNSNISYAGTGYTIATLSDGSLKSIWPDTERKSDDVCYNLTDLSFATPTATLSYHFDGAFAGAPNRDWRFFASKAKDLTIYNNSDFSVENGVDKTYIIELTVTPK